MTMWGIKGNIDATNNHAAFKAISCLKFIHASLALACNDYICELLCLGFSWTGYLCNWSSRRKYFQNNRNVLQKPSIKLKIFSRRQISYTTLYKCMYKTDWWLNTTVIIRRQCVQWPCVTAQLTHEAAVHQHHNTGDMAQTSASQNPDPASS